MTERTFERSAFEKRLKEISGLKAEVAGLLTRLRKESESAVYKQLLARALNLDDDYVAIRRATVANAGKGDWGLYERTRPRLTPLPDGIFTSVSDLAEAPLLTHQRAVPGGGGIDDDDIATAIAEERADDNPAPVAKPARGNAWGPVR